MTPMMVNFVAQLSWIADSRKRTEGASISSGDLQMVIRKLYNLKEESMYLTNEFSDSTNPVDIINSAMLISRAETLDEVCTMLCKLWQHQPIEK